MDYEEEDWDADGLAYSLEVAMGMKSDRMSKRTAAEEIWTAIAEGRANELTNIAWVDHVARQAIEHGLVGQSDAETRGTRALHTIGLYGHADEQRWMRARLQDFLMFDDLTVPPGMPQPKPKMRDLVNVLRRDGCFTGVRDRDAAKRVTRILDSLGQEV
jgi:hypothetical protein